MGFEQLENIEEFHFIDFSAGYYPLKNRRDVPANYYTSKGSPKILKNGFVDMQHCIYYNGELRQFFGYVPQCAGQINSGGDGLGFGQAEWLGQLRQYGVFGNKFYEFDDLGNETDRTGFVTLNTSQPYVHKQHIQGSNQFVIGGNGYGSMYKWTGAGSDISVLGGTPHNYQSFDYYGERWWGVRRDTNWNFLYGSDYTDPESNWNDSGELIPYKDSLYGCVSVGSWLAVIGQKTVNSLTGFGQTSFKKDEGIFGFGTTAHRTLQKGLLYNEYYQQWMDGFYMVTKSGPVFVTESKRVYSIGDPINEEFTAATGITIDALNTCVGKWIDTLKWYVFAVPYNAEVLPNKLFVFDAKYQSLWPMPDFIHDGSTRYYIRDITSMTLNGVEYVFVQDNNGWYYRLNPDEMNYYPNNTKTAVQAHAQSPVYDLQGYWKLREPVVYAKSLGDWNLDILIGFDNDAGGGTLGQLDLLTGVGLGSFILGASTLGGSTYIYNFVDIAGEGSYVQFTFKNYNTDETFAVDEILMWMKFVRKRSMRSIS